MAARFFQHEHPSEQSLQGQHRGRQDFSSLFLSTMYYSLRRALCLDSVDGCTHNSTSRGHVLATKVLSQREHGLESPPATGGIETCSSIFRISIG